MPRLVVVGGGAAGMFCAVNAARLHPQWEVVVLEKTDRLLMKVKISGGGRCNVTHDLYAVPDLLKKYPRGGTLLKKELYAFGPQDTRDWFAQRGVALVAEADGRMFPVSNQSQTIIDCLLQEAQKTGVKIMTQSEAVAIHPFGEGRRGGRVHLSNGRQWEADALCLATGGYPKSSQYQWLGNLAHPLVAPVPSLFTFNLPRHPITALMGVSLPQARVKILGSKWQEEGPVLITHWGLSGPAVLRLSAVAAVELAQRQYQFEVLVNWLGETSEQDLRADWPAWRQEKGKQLMHKHPPVALPLRLWQFLLDGAGIPDHFRWADHSAAQQNQLIQSLTAFRANVSGKTTYKEEFVTAGGFDLQAIDPATGQSKRHPGIYFAGEAMNIDGVTGGFNFQHAWASAMAVAQALVD